MIQLAENPGFSASNPTSSRSLRLAKLMIFDQQFGYQLL
jgi:hypothetical protein